MHVSIIITAGGIGKRMGGDLPKQFIEINGLPVLMHTMRFFHFQDPNAQIVLTLPEEWKLYWVDLQKKYQFMVPHTVVDGGKERYHSVKNALAICTGEIVAVHDAVRPCVSEVTWRHCLENVYLQSAVIPVLKVKESLRKLNEQGSESVVREVYRIVQTPQVFLKEVLLSAYQQDFSDWVTDDACLVEANGVKIHLVEGNEENIKITTPNDLIIVEHYLKNR
jgi:2-C-methyl-D-erythritol 4-phosphate cytidylyltransferase